MIQGGDHDLTIMVVGRYASEIDDCPGMVGDFQKGIYEYSRDGPFW